VNDNLINLLAREVIEEHGEFLELLALEEFYPTPEMEQAARDAACYGQDDAALCIEPEVTDCGQVIPEWAFI
tara:strand:+ start:127 stop:342 length:216 start_codon:yes stop_codon:yes gene_type:complete